MTTNTNLLLTEPALDLQHGSLLAVEMSAAVIAPISDSLFVLSSNDESVASVEEGVVTFRKRGSVILTVKGLSVTVDASLGVAPVSPLCLGCEELTNMLKTRTNSSSLLVDELKKILEPKPVVHTDAFLPTQRLKTSLGNGFLVMEGRTGAGHLIQHSLELPRIVFPSRGLPLAKAVPTLFSAGILAEDGRVVNAAGTGCVNQSSDPSDCAACEPVRSSGDVALPFEEILRCDTSNTFGWTEPSDCSTRVCTYDTSMGTFKITRTHEGEVTTIAQRNDFFAFDRPWTR